MRFRITTEEQREKVIKKLTYMMIDHITEEAEDKARDCVRSLFDFNIDSSDEYHIRYSFDFNGGLLKVLLGSVKRENTKKGGKKKSNNDVSIRKTIQNEEAKILIKKMANTKQ